LDARHFLVGGGSFEATGHANREGLRRRSQIQEATVPRQKAEVEVEGIAVEVVEVVEVGPSTNSTTTWKPPSFVL
jgi:hypothetical protein